MHNFSHVESSATDKPDQQCSQYEHASETWSTNTGEGTGIEDFLFYYPSVLKCFTKPYDCVMVSTTTALCFGTANSASSP